MTLVPVIKRIKLILSSIFLISTHVVLLKYTTKNGGQLYLAYGAPLNMTFLHIHYLFMIVHNLNQVTNYRFNLCWIDIKNKVKFEFTTKNKK